jgi:hypothetical protein
MTGTPFSTPQSVQIFHSLGFPLGVLIKDAFNNPVPNIPVTFTVPSSGPSLYLTLATVETDSAGRAVAAQSGSNNLLGSYTVTASATSLPFVAFALTNISTGVSWLASNFTLAAPANLGATFPVAPSVTAYDEGDNPLPGIAITFTAPASGASGTFSNGSNVITMTTNALGTAAAPYTANHTGGAYNIWAATVLGVGTTIPVLNVGPPAYLACVAGCAQSAYVGGQFAPIQVGVYDSWGTPVAGAPITITSTPNPIDNGYAGNPPAFAYFVSGTTSSSFLLARSATATSGAYNTASWGVATFTAMPNCGPSELLDHTGSVFESWEYAMSATSGAASSGPFNYDSNYGDNFMNLPTPSWMLGCNPQTLGGPLMLPFGTVVQ